MSCLINKYVSRLVYMVYFRILFLLVFVFCKAVCSASDKVAIIFSPDRGDGLIINHASNAKKLFEDHGFKVIYLSEDATAEKLKDVIQKNKDAKEIQISFIGHGEIVSTDDKFDQKRFLPQVISDNSYKISDPKEPKHYYYRIVVPDKEGNSSIEDSVGVGDIRSAILDFQSKSEYQKTKITISALNCYGGNLGEGLSDLPNVQVFTATSTSNVSRDGDEYLKIFSSLPVETSFMSIEKNWPKEPEGFLDYVKRGRSPETSKAYKIMQKIFGGDQKSWESKFNKEFTLENYKKLNKDEQAYLFHLMSSDYLNAANKNYTDFFYEALSTKKTYREAHSEALRKSLELLLSPERLISRGGVWFEGHPTDSRQSFISNWCNDNLIHKKSEMSAGCNESQTILKAHPIEDIVLDLAKSDVLKNYNTIIESYSKNIISPLKCLETESQSQASAPAKLLRKKVLLKMFESIKSSMSDKENSQYLTCVNPKDNFNQCNNSCGEFYRTLFMKHGTSDSDNDLFNSMTEKCSSSVGEFSYDSYFNEGHAYIGCLQENFFTPNANVYSAALGASQMCKELSPMNYYCKPAIDATIYYKNQIKCVDNFSRNASLKDKERLIHLYEMSNRTIED